MQYNTEFIKAIQDLIDNDPAMPEEKRKALVKMYIYSLASLRCRSTGFLLRSKIQLQRANLTNIILIGAQRWRTLPSPLTRKLGGSRFLLFWKNVSKKSFGSAMHCRGIVRMINSKFRFWRRGKRSVLSMVI